ncbi:MAG: class I SAM-dependent methyltransferase [Fidelibacterota bacterium]
MKKGLVNAENVLDIGCGTGNLALEVAKQNCLIKALDFDREMVTMAKAKNNSANPEFLHMDMRKIADHFRADSFDLAYCFGNTIAHLLSDEQIGAFLHSVKSVLKQKGKFLFQLLNYENILANKTTQLPLIENNTIKFERYYEFNDAKLVDFITILTIKSTNETIKNRIKLYPVTKRRLIKLLHETGFRNSNFFSGFNMKSLDDTSLPLVGSCQLE